MTCKGSEQPCEPGKERSGLVPIIFAANLAEAQFYQTILADADIEAAIDSDTSKLNVHQDKGVAVLVAAELLDEATEVITVREEMEAHILSSPDEADKDSDDDEDELSPSHLDDDNIEDEEDFLFHRDPFMDEDEY